MIVITIILDDLMPQRIRMLAPCIAVKIKVVLCKAIRNKFLCRVRLPDQVQFARPVTPFKFGLTDALFSSGFFNILKTSDDTIKLLFSSFAAAWMKYANPRDTTHRESPAYSTPQLLDQWKNGTIFVKLHVPRCLSK